MTQAQLIRSNAELGFSPSTIAGMMQLPLALVKATLKRRTRPGKPGGKCTLKNQIKYARRIAESASDATSRALAQTLLISLQAELNGIAETL